MPFEQGDFSTGSTTEGGGGVLLNGQNLLSVAKVISRHSLIHTAINNDVDNILFDSWPLPRKLSSPVFQFYVYVGSMFYKSYDSFY